MNKTILVFVVAAILFSACGSLPKPESDAVAAVIGKFKVNFDGREELINPGTEDQGIKLTLINLDSDKHYFTYVKNGYYYFLNLQPGRYEIAEWRIRKSRGRDRFTLTGHMGGSSALTFDAGKFSILPNITISVVTSKNTFNVDVGNPDSNELKEYLQGLDSNGVWADFLW